MARRTTPQPRTRKPRRPRTPTATGRSFLGKSPEERHADRRTQLLEAALDLAGSEGWQAVSMRAVCRRAALTQRYFYESFATPEDLLLALFDTIAADAQTVFLAALATAPQDGVARIRAATEALVAFVLSHPGKGRVLLLEATSDPALLERRRRVMGAFIALSVVASEQHAPEADVTTTDRQLTARAVGGALAELLAAELRGELGISPERLVRHVTQLIVNTAQITSEPAATE